MKKGIIVSLILVIGLMGLGMADIDIPPCDCDVVENEAGEASPACGNQACTNCTNCTVIIMVICNCAPPDSFFFFKCEFRRGLASVFIYLLARMPRGFASVKFIDTWKRHIVIWYKG